MGTSSVEFYHFHVVRRHVVHRIAFYRKVTPMPVCRNSLTKEKYNSWLAAAFGGQELHYDVVIDNHDKIVWTWLPKKEPRLPSLEKREWQFKLGYIGAMLNGARLNNYNRRVIYKGMEPDAFWRTRQILSIGVEVHTHGWLNSHDSTIERAIGSTQCASPVSDHISNRSLHWDYWNGPFCRFSTCRM